MLKKINFSSNYILSYFDRSIQKTEWRMDVRGEDLLPPHPHSVHPGNTAFLTPHQPLQGPSKTEPRPLPPAPGPPAPTFRYSKCSFKK